MCTFNKSATWYSDHFRIQFVLYYSSDSMCGDYSVIVSLFVYSFSLWDFLIPQIQVNLGVLLRCSYSTSDIKDTPHHGKLPLPQRGRKMSERDRENGYSSAKVSVSALARKTNEFDYKCTTDKKSLVHAGGTAHIWNAKRTLKWPQQDNQSERISS